MSRTLELLWTEKARKPGDTWLFITSVKAPRWKMFCSIGKLPATTDTLDQVPRNRYAPSRRHAWIDKISRPQQTNDLFSRSACPGLHPKAQSDTQAVLARRDGFIASR